MTQAVNSVVPKTLASKTGTIGILMGGYSSEREISLKSGRAVVESLTKAGCLVTPLDISTPDRTEIMDAIRGANIRLAFIALHGKFGEDGTIQLILEELKIPYTGSGVEASACAFNKILTQRKLKAHGLPVADFSVVYDGSQDLEGILKESGKFPLVVKPACEGSSFGVNLARDKEGLTAALMEAFRYGPEAIVEHFIPGRELTVGILEKQALPIVEIRSQKQKQLFDFEAKYQKGLTDYIVPAPLPEGLARRIGKIALQAHQVVGCESYSRVDFRLDLDGCPFILEINTIPGFTETSLFPKAARQAGLDFTEVCLKLVQMAYGKKKQS